MSDVYEIKQPSELLITINALQSEIKLSKAISKAPGVGGKTAQRVILELKDKLSLEDAFEAKTEHVQKNAAAAGGSVKNDAVMALTALGYSSTESLKG